MNSIGANIRRIREEKGFTAEYMSNLTGFQKKDIYDWENEIRQPELTVIEQIAKALDVKAEILLYGSSEEENEDGETSYKMVPLVMIVFLIVIAAGYIFGFPQIGIVLLAGLCTYHKIDVIDELASVKKELNELKKSVRTSGNTEERASKEQQDEKQANV